MNIDIRYIPVRRESVERYKAHVMKRDNYTCRYCGNKKPPFHIDHVYPVIKGGETSTANLVTACQRCNTEKHATIGIWPKPIGHFDDPKNNGYLPRKHAVVHLLSILFAMSGFAAMMLTKDFMYITVAVFGTGACFTNAVYANDHID